MRGPIGDDDGGGEKSCVRHQAHDRPTLAAFLDGETRQVWARHRVTLEPIYIEQGTAEAVREVARRDWSCIVPVCSAPISTRGGSKRDHFFHRAVADHPGGPETLNHLAAKAMLAQWAAAQIGHAGTVREEQTIKNGVDLYRRPDVLATWNDGRRVALEVEYKFFRDQDWAAKQRDFDREGVVCSWLLGHTRIRLDEDLDPEAGGARLVRVLLLGQALAQAGHWVLIVNPLTRQVGTLVGDDRLNHRWAGHWAYAGLGLDELADCELDPERGMVTPTMRRIDEAEAVRARAQQQRQLEEQTRQKEASRPAGRWAQIEQANRKAWEASPLGRVLEQRWGNVPEVLTCDGHSPWGIHALPIHWHAVIYEALVHNREPGFTFGPHDCWKALHEAGINTNWDRAKRFNSLAGFLDVVTRADLIRRSSEYQWKVIANLDTVVESRRQAEGEAMSRRLERAEQIRREEAVARAERAAKMADRARRDAERLQNAKDHEAAWQVSDLRAQIVSRYGAVPRCVAWPNTFRAGVIAAAPEHWRAIVCVGLVEDQTPGTEVNVDKAKGLIRSAGIDFIGSEAEVSRAVSNYLINLRQRRILSPGPDDFHFTATGAGLA